MLFKDWVLLEQYLKNKVGKLNRMIKQHSESAFILSWIDMKEFIETEILGYPVNDIT